MAIQVMYAPLSYVSPSLLAKSAPQLAAYEGYGMAKLQCARLPPSLLATKAIAKFYHDPEKREPTIEELAQLEFMEIPQRGAALEVIQASFYEAALGRVSLVPQGGMQHNVSETVELLSGLSGLHEALSRDCVELEDIHHYKAEMSGVYQSLKRLNELRAERGFDETINRAYGFLCVGYLTAYIYLLNKSVEHGIESIAEGADLPEARALKRLFDARALQLLNDTRDECESTGPNHAIDFDELGIGDINELG